MTFEQARKIALAQKGATEGSHHGHPDFRANGKIFATLQPQKGVGAIRLLPEMAMSLAKDDPQTFRPMPSTPKNGWLVADLSKLKTAEYRRLIAIAHKLAEQH